MPSQQDPSDIETGPGKLPIDVATAATNLFAISTASILTSLSDITNREISVPTPSNSLTAGSDLSAITLASFNGPFFVGDNGSDDVNSLFRVVVGTGAIDAEQEVFNPNTHQYVEVASITPATIGSGFYSGNLTLNLTTPIPTGKSYKVYYGKRSTLGAIPPDATSFPSILRSVDRARLPEIERLGLAPTSVATPVSITSTGFPDPYMAQWKAVLRGPQFNSDPSFAYGGSVGFLNIGRKKNVNDADDQGLQGHQAAGFLSVYVKEIIGTGTIAGANPLTRINPANSCLAVSNSDVQLAAGDFFRTTTSSAVRPGLDMLEVTRASGKQEVYIITSFDAADVRRVSLRTLSGGVPTFSVSEAISCRWIRPNFFTGGDNDIVAATLSSPERFYLTSTGNFVCGPITDNSSVEHAQEPPFFGAARNTRTGADAGRGFWDAIAFRWGGFNMVDAAVNQIGRRDVLGELWGDGSIETYGGRIRGLHAHRGDQIGLNSTQTYTWDPALYQQIHFAPVTNSAIVITIAFATTYTPVAGDRLTFFLDYTSFGTATTFVFPANFKFSGTDGATPIATGTISKYEGAYSNGKFYFTRTEY